MTIPARSGGWLIRRYGQVTSTMEVAALLVTAGRIDGPTVIVADHQTAGRGRANRTWSSVPGAALQMTAVLSLPAPIQRLGPVPLLVGVAVAEALESLDAGLDVRLKWPNDVLIDGRKVAGILIVSRSVSETTVLQIGIGINVVASDLSPAASGLDHLLSSPPTPAETDALRERLLEEVLSRLIDLPSDILRDGGAVGLTRWTRRATLLGEQVTVRDGDRTVDGILLGVDGRGALRLETAPRIVTMVVAGDLTRGPRQMVRPAAGDVR
jgi:BirA family biotin operon repressor/biotin-[acetyl-CoA-carboxylase] ligase